MLPLAAQQTPLLTINGGTGPNVSICNTATLKVSGGKTVIGKANYEWRFYQNNLLFDSKNEERECVTGQPCQVPTYVAIAKMPLAYGKWTARLTVKTGLTVHSDEATNSIQVGPMAPAASCKVNGSTAAVINVCPGGPIRVDGSESACAQNYFIAIQRSDEWWGLSGIEAARNLTTPDYLEFGPISSWDVKGFAEKYAGFKFEGGQYYRIKLAVKPPWNEQSRLIHVMKPVSSFTINGKSADAISVAGTSGIMLNGQASICGTQYFVSVHQANANWQGFGPEKMKWLNAADLAKFGPIASFDVKKFAAAQGLPMTLGNRYLVKLAVGPEWAEKTRLVYIDPNLAPKDGLEGGAKTGAR
jgi:hypothetical protein